MVNLPSITYITNRSREQQQQRRSSRRNHNKRNIEASSTDRPRYSLLSKRKLRKMMGRSPYQRDFSLTLNTGSWQSSRVFIFGVILAVVKPSSWISFSTLCQQKSAKESYTIMNLCLRFIRKSITWIKSWKTQARTLLPKWETTSVKIYQYFVWMSSKYWISQMPWFWSASLRLFGTTMCSSLWLVTDLQKTFTSTACSGSYSFHLSIYSKSGHTSLSKVYIIN